MLNDETVDLVGKSLCKILKKGSQPIIHDLSLWCQESSFLNLFYTYRNSFTQFLVKLNDIESNSSQYLKYIILYYFI